MTIDTDKLQHLLDTNPHTTLPAGDFYFDRPLRLPVRQGGYLRGHGCPYTFPHQSTGWNNKNASTRLIYTGPKDTPALILEPCHHFVVQDLGVCHQNGGLAVLYPRLQGWGGAQCEFMRVAFSTGETGPWGFQAGEEGENGNTADVLFTNCLWSRCGFTSRSHQSVNFHFRSNYWLYPPEACVYTQRGGMAVIDAPVTYGAKALLNAGEGGVGAPNSIRDASLDRSDGYPVTLVVDMSEARRDCLVNVSGFLKITGSTEDRTPYPIYRMPPAGKWKPWAQRVDHQATLSSHFQIYTQPQPAES